MAEAGVQGQPGLLFKTPVPKKPKQMQNPSKVPQNCVAKELVQRFPSAVGPQPQTHSLCMTGSDSQAGQVRLGSPQDTPSPFPFNSQINERFREDRRCMQFPQLIQRQSKHLRSFQWFKSTSLLITEHSFISIHTVLPTQRPST